MAKVRKTKTELKKQKEDLERFERFLPTLELKKKQLLAVIRSLEKEIEEIRSQIQRRQQEVSKWAGVMAEDIDLTEFIELDEIKTYPDNVAGVDTESFEEVTFNENDYDYFATPLWIDTAVKEIKTQLELRGKIVVFERQIEALQEELRITIQRINLFEKVKIPEAKENIRQIQIYLDDLQTAEVVRGKIAKDKIKAKKEAKQAAAAGETT